jgi:lipid-binding SYLF domain-containing protein
MKGDPVELPAGATLKAIVFLFSTVNAPETFRHGESWSAGAEASLAVIKIGASGNVDTAREIGRRAPFC